MLYNDTKFTLNISRNQGLQLNNLLKEVHRLNYKHLGNARKQEFLNCFNERLLQVQNEIEVKESNGDLIDLEEQFAVIKEMLEDEIAFVEMTNETPTLVNKPKRKSYEDFKSKLPKLEEY